MNHWMIIRYAQKHVEDISKKVTSGNRYDLLLSEFSTDLELRIYNKKDGTVCRTAFSCPNSEELLAKLVDKLTQRIQTYEAVYNSPLMRALS